MDDDYEFKLARDSRIHGELLECLRKGVSAEERGPLTLPSGFADECGVRPRGHGGNCVGGNAGSIAMDVARLGGGRGPRVHGVDVGTRTASEVQVGGNHYSKYPIQPTRYIEENGLSWSQGNIIKYATRYKDKNGAKDVAKVIHYAMLILEREYNTTFEEVLQDD